jgi:hypothetical protein
MWFFAILFSKRYNNMNNNKSFNPEANFTCNVNFMPLENAYKIHHTNNIPYGDGVKIVAKYSDQCPFCSSNNTISLMQDGSFKRCQQCRKEFRSTILTKSAPNYSISTDHLKTTH